MTLTEQWDKGKLPEGDYYIKRRNGNFLYDNIDTSGVWRNSIDEDILEILAPVPSFEEWRELKEASDGLSKLMFKSLMNRFVKADEEKERLAEENQHLKELLHSLKCCLTSENIEPQIRVEKSLAKIKEFLTDGK